MIRAGIIGATGYAGQQLAWLLTLHSKMELSFLAAHSHGGENFSEIYSNFHGFIKDSCISMQEAEHRLDSIDVLFLALPHGKSFDIVRKALGHGVKVIDLGSDYRLKSSASYEQWYGVRHECTDLLESSVYGLPELNREEIRNGDLIANPGCYPTASILGLSPLLKNDIIDPASIIIDAKSGVSGAGRSAKTDLLYCECNESIKAYGVAGHRHTPEIEQALSNVLGRDILISFTPHLTPMNRGILATCYGKLNKSVSLKELYEIYNSFYHNEHFVRVKDTLPETRYVRGSNFCDIGLRVDERTGRVIVVSAIDNLVKGAAGQAVQNMNITFGIDEAEGLKMPAMVP